jgi:hypothetical protein
MLVAGCSMLDTRYWILEGGEGRMEKEEWRMEDGGGGWRLDGCGRVR